MKWILHLLLIGALGTGWFLHVKAQRDTTAKVAQVQARIDEGIEDQDTLMKEKQNLISQKDERGFEGFLLSFLSAGYVGIVFVVHALPALAHRFTHTVYDSGEMIEKDIYHDARSKVAQGDYLGAIEAFRLAAGQDPQNRLPWVEIAKIQKENLENADAAIRTLRSALESHAWPENDAAYLLFRLAEMYDEDKSDRDSAVVILEQVIGQFPGTRHSANARHKLHDWGLM